MDLVKLSKKGQVSIPRAILRQLGIEGETPLLVAATPQGSIELRPAAVFPVEIYSEERQAEFAREDEMPPAERAKLQRSLQKARKRA